MSAWLAFCSHDQDGQAVLPVQGADRIENLARDQRREPERGLVEQEQAGTAHQGAADRQHLLLAAGQGSAALGVAFLQPWKQIEDAFQRRVALGIGASGGIGTHLEVLRHAHAREDAPSLRRLRDAQMRDLVGGHVGDVAAFVQDLAGTGPRLAEDGHHQRRLAGAVGADQRHDLAGIDFDVDALQRLDLAVGGAKAADREQGSG
ncbi:hypothetical protein ABIF42_006560 [Bradyrhizobium diazoefficiens]